MSGSCILYVFEAKNSGFIVDMRLFFVSTDFCPKEYSLRLSSKNISVFDQLEVQLRGRPNSWATLHAFDNRLDALLRSRSDFRQRVQHYWDFAEFLHPDRHSTDTAWALNLLRVNELYAKMKETCHYFGRFAVKCPFRRFYKTSVSHLSDVCFDELNRKCENASSEC